MKNSFLIAIALTLATGPHLHANPSTDLPPDASYVRVSPDGHLELEGQRVRFWGTVVNYLPAKDKSFALSNNDTPAERDDKIARRRAVTIAHVERVVAMGFNMVRTWDGIDLTKPYTAGDGSEQDFFAFALNEFDKRGVKIWFTGFNQVGVLSPSDVNRIDDPETADAWSAAVEEMAKTRAAKNKGSSLGLRSIYINAWDPRTEKVRLERMAAMVNFPNHYKGGLQLKDDPQIAVWELSNEEWWLTAMANGRWQTLPQFFQNSLLAKWRGWLTAKYKNDDGLRAAWGFLLPKESLNGQVLLAPIAKPVSNLVLNDANALAVAAQTATEQKYERDDFTRQRGEDVIAFLLDTVANLKLKERDFVKNLGKSTRLSPLVFDTGDGYRIQAVYLHQLADAVTMCTYLEGYAKDPQEKRFPWFSYLDEPPRMAHDVPWAEIGRVPGKPFFIYETQTMGPNKYRAEFPYRLLALAAIQDWDIINWHIWHRPAIPDGDDDKLPYDRALEIAHGGFPAEGFHFRNDEVQMSAMRMAADMFKNGAFKTVETPTTITWGSKSLYDPASLDYGRSFGDLGKQFASTAFRHGLFMKVDPTREDDLVEGPMVLARVHEANPIRPTDQITFDWQRACLQMDSPSALVYTGFLSQHGGDVTFANGTTLKNVTFKNDENIAFPMTPEEGFIAFGVVSTDGKPLGEADTVRVSLVSTSFNDGFQMDPDAVARGKVYENYKVGKAPVRVARVGGTLHGDWLKGRTYRLLDWHLNTIGQGKIDGDTLTIPADQKVFQVELTR